MSEIRSVKRGEREREREKERERREREKERKVVIIKGAFQETSCKGSIFSDILRMQSLFSWRVCTHDTSYYFHFNVNYSKRNYWKNQKFKHPQPFTTLSCLFMILYFQACWRSQLDHARFTTKNLTCFDSSFFFFFLVY